MKKFMVYTLMVLALHVGFVEQAYGAGRKQSPVSTQAVSKRGSIADVKQLTTAAKQKQFMSSYLYTHVCKHNLIGLFESALKGQTNDIAREFYEAHKAERPPLTMIYTHDDWLACMTFFLERDKKKGKKDAEETCKKLMLEKFITHFNTQLQLQEKDTNYLERYMPREKIKGLLAMAGIKLKAFVEPDDTKFAEEDEGYDDDIYKRKRDYTDKDQAVRALKAIQERYNKLKFLFEKNQRCCLCCYKEPQDVQIDEKNLVAVNKEIRRLRARIEVLDKELRKMKEERFGGKCHTGCCGCIALCWNDSCCSSCACEVEEIDFDADNGGREDHKRLDLALRELMALKERNKKLKPKVVKKERCFLCCYKETEDVRIDEKDFQAVMREVERLRRDNDNLEEDLAKIKQEWCGGKCHEGRCGCLTLCWNDCCCPVCQDNGGKCCSCSCKGNKVSPAPTSKGPRQQTMR